MTRLVVTRRGRLAPVVLGLLLLAALATGIVGDRASTDVDREAAPGADAEAGAVPIADQPGGDAAAGGSPAPAEAAGASSPSPEAGTPSPEPTATAPPPVLRVSSSLPVIGEGSARVSGTVEHVSRLEAGGRPVRVADDGTFDLSYRRLPPDGLTLEATGLDGTTVSEEVLLASVQSRVVPEEIRGVHVSFYGWADARLREPVLEMADRGQINTVQLDLKDESGMVGYRTGVEMAHTIGAAAGVYDLEAAVRELHDRGLHVVGRIVAFRDPVLAGWAWGNGHREMVIQTASGEAYGGYGGFANFADPGVRDYNVAVAVEAAAAGVDTILWDYIRRPDGAVEGFTFPGLQGSPEEGVAAFVAQADEALRPYRVQHGVSVYGIAVDRPRQIAQDIPAMAEHVDIVAPMVYPSHWGPGEYDVADPEAQPYDITLASLGAFAELLDGSRARVVPWLQDFTLRVPYGPAEVRAQIDAAADAGVNEWLMWDPHVRYNREAYEAGTAPANEVHLPPPPPAVALDRAR